MEWGLGCHIYKNTAGLVVCVLSLAVKREKVTHIVTSKPEVVPT